MGRRELKHPMQRCALEKNTSVRPVIALSLNTKRMFLHAFALERALSYHEEDGEPSRTTTKARKADNGQRARSYRVRGQVIFPSYFPQSIKSVRYIQKKEQPFVPLLCAAAFPRRHHATLLSRTRRTQAAGHAATRKTTRSQAETAVQRLGAKEAHRRTCWSRAASSSCSYAHILAAQGT